MKVLIVGRGLAGSWLAWYLIQRGHDVTISDGTSTTSASRVAAGLINPTTGSRPKSTWRSEVILPFAQRAYADFASEAGSDVWSERTIRRVFRTQKDKDLWENAVARGVGVDWSPLNGTEIDGLDLPFGGVQYSGATIDTNVFLDVAGTHLAKAGLSIADEVVDESDADHDLIFWCQGWSAANSSLWSWLPFQPVKGEIIDAVINGPSLLAVYIRGIWVIPYDNDPVAGWQRVRIGATHDWDQLDDQPTEAARVQLVSKASELLRRQVEVTGHTAAVRPAARSKRPFLGRHPEQPRHIIMNGLGSKGSLWAPWAAHHLVRHIFDGDALDDEVNILRWWNHV